VESDRGCYTARQDSAARFRIGGINHRNARALIRIAGVPRMRARVHIRE